MSGGSSLTAAELEQEVANASSFFLSPFFFPLPFFLFLFLHARSARVKVH